MESKKLILGINGWIEGSHDASAVLIESKGEDNKIIMGLEEEKVVGKKGLVDVFPVNSIEEILSTYKLSPKEISAIAIGWDYPKIYKQLNQTFPLSDKEILSMLFPNLADDSFEIPIHFVNHHYSHALSSYAISGFEKSIILVIDGCGEEESTSLWMGDGRSISLLEKFDAESSLGFLFEAANTMLGFRVNESGKTMGLAGYGEPKYTNTLLKYFDDKMNTSLEFKKICNRFNFLHKKELLLPFQEVCIRSWRYIFEYVLKLSPLESSNLDSFYSFPSELKDLAASIQKVVEILVLNYVDINLNSYDINKICLSGGVALNCILNGKILENDLVEDIFVIPAANDVGVSLGAALECARKINGHFKVSQFNPYIGKEYTDEEVKVFLNENKIEFEYVKDSSKKIAIDLFKNNTIGLFQGRNEWGPRALGNRSIITLPKRGNLDFINKNVKERELGRPLAPSMLQDELVLFLEKEVKKYGKFMNIAYNSSINEDSVASIVHIDNTFRPQCVCENDNPTYFNQLKEIKSICGKSTIINTSLNKNSPIVYSLTQAIELLKNSKICSLIINNKFIVGGDQWNSQ